MASSGVVFNIQRFSIHDGPGIRTTVFLKECAMGCFWCHNPEGRNPDPEIQYFPSRCIACGECVKVCPNGAHELREGVHVFLRDRCATAAECVKVCCSNALELNGRRMSVEEVVEEVLRDRPFYDTSHGGVTLSGGEPALNSEFARDILASCKEKGLHTAIETCGYYPWSSLERLLPVTDLVMMDVKLISPDRHRAVTRNSNEVILANARRLALTDKQLTFRTPVVPTVNDSEEEFGKIASFIRSLLDLREGKGGIRYELLPFHRMAADKYASLGLGYEAAELVPPSKSKMRELSNIARSYGVDALIR